MLSAYLRPFLYCLRSYSFYTTKPTPSTTTNESQLSLIRWSLSLSRLELGATRTMICLRTASFDSASCCCAFLPVLLISLAIYLSLARNPHAHTNATAVPTTKTPLACVCVCVCRSLLLLRRGQNAKETKPDAQASFLGYSLRVTCPRYDAYSGAFSEVDTPAPRESEKSREWVRVGPSLSETVV